jgi:hypothetical protein
LLVCDKKALADRLSKYVAVGLRKPDIIERGIERLLLYDSIGSVNDVKQHQCGRGRSADCGKREAMNQQNMLNIIDWLKDNDITVWVDGD